MSRDILLALIDPDPNNARHSFDEATIAELADSIAASGLAVPIMVRPTGERFTIVHGERRFRAVKSLGWQTVPADVRDIDADSASWLALVENVQRADLSSIDEAQAYQVKLATGITQGELGRRIGKTQSYIATKLRFLKLSALVQAGIRFNMISEGHAKQLLRLDCTEVQDFCASVIVHDKLSVLQLKERVDKLLADAPADLENYSDAWKFTEALRIEPDESPLVKRYGRHTRVGWLPPEELSKEDWLFGLKMGFVIFKVQSIIKDELIEV